MSYQDTLITVAPDTTAETASEPTTKRAKTPAHIFQHQLLIQDPYTLDHHELTFEVYVRQKEIPSTELESDRDQLWEAFHSKGQPCMRASSLTKKFGWGAHYNSAGKIALIPMESAEYQNLLNDESVKKIPAMKSRRK
ncbi:MAG: DUF6157 family protein [Chloroflexota bacterium]